MSSSTGRTSTRHRETSETGSPAKRDKDPEQDQQSADLIVYARDTMEEILGWYGLQTTNASMTPDDVHAAVPTKSTTAPTQAASLGFNVERDESIGGTSCSSASGNSSGNGTLTSGSVQRRGRSNGDELPLDLTSANVIVMPDGDIKSPSPLSATATMTMVAVPNSVARQQNKKLVGIRYLFPAFDERTTLLDRARVWVARHDYKYFVDWTEEQLQSVDSALRPYAPITRDVYKLHMNRSEYCRNVKLKYCLVADEPWAQAFRSRLASSPSEGGFTGLCQAKIAAAELWRKYSENYRSHQARHTPPGSATGGRRLQRASVASEQPENDYRFEQHNDGSHRHGRRQLDYCNSPNLDDNDDATSRTPGADKWDDERLCVDDVETRNTEMETDGEICAKISLCVAANIGSMPTTENHVGKQETDQFDECDDKMNDVSSREDRRDRLSTADADNSSTHPEIERSLSPAEEAGTGKPQQETRDVLSGSPTADESQGSGRSTVVGREQNNNVVGLKMPLLADVMKLAAVHRPSLFSSVTARDVNDDEDFRNGRPMLDAVVVMTSALFDARQQQQSDSVGNTGEVGAKLAGGVAPDSRLDHVTTGCGPTPAKATKRSSSNASAANHLQRQNLRKTTEQSPTSGDTSPTAAAAADYRRSERGLSFLFPSFADHHGMSLIDKVRVTVARHKNNYFLGWTEEQLDQLDPVVRPRVPVTAAVYREYCHRNAMKYDSNLQFACESPEPWAIEFRRRLAMSPADGGFTSLCEVKLEAGRLWREHSGRYRMHNIVKWQMGMNAAVGVVSAAGTAGNNDGQTTTSDTASHRRNRSSFANDSTKKSKQNRSRRAMFPPANSSAKYERASSSDLTSGHLGRDALSEASNALDLSVPSTMNGREPDPWSPLISPKLESPTGNYFRSCSSSASSASCSGGTVATGGPSSGNDAHDLTRRSSTLPSPSSSSSTTTSGAERTRHRSPRKVQSLHSPTVSVTPLDMTSKMTSFHRRVSHDDDDQTNPEGVVGDFAANGTGNTYQPIAFGMSGPMHAAAATAASFPFFGARFDAHPYPGLMWPPGASGGVRPATVAMNGGCFDPSRIPAEYVHAAAAAAAAGMYHHPMVTGPMALTPAMAAAAAAAAASWPGVATAAGQAVVDLSDRACRPTSQMLTDAFRRYVSGGEAALVNMLQFGTRPIDSRGAVDDNQDRRQVVDHRSTSGGSSVSEKGEETAATEVGESAFSPSSDDVTRRRTLNDDEEESIPDLKRRRAIMVGDVDGPTSERTAPIDEVGYSRRSSSGSLLSTTPTPADLNHDDDDVDDVVATHGSDVDIDDGIRGPTPETAKVDGAAVVGGRSMAADEPEDDVDGLKDDQHLIGLSSVVALLWSARDDLHLACRGIGSSSEKIDEGELCKRPCFDRSLIDILEAAVGPNYAVPDDGISAAVDLVLAFMQRRLVAADRETRGRERRPRRVQRRQRGAARNDQKTSKQRNVSATDAKNGSWIKVLNDSNVPL